MSVLATFAENFGYNESGKRRIVVANVAYTAEAHSNGYALDKKVLSFQAEIEGVLAIHLSAGDARLAKWDRANQTIRIYASGSGTEEVAALTETIEVIAIGN